MSSAAEGQLAFEGSSEFHLLEEKIYRTIELLKAARSEKAAAELELANLHELLELQTAENESLRKQLQALEMERAELRGRTEKLLAEVDSILEQ
jgi:chromosome segregation ATPase